MDEKNIKRIKTLRDAAITPVRKDTDFRLYFFEKYEELSDKPYWERYAGAYIHAFSNLKPTISEGELIVGKSTRELSEEEAARWEEHTSAYAENVYAGLQVGQDSHMAIDYELLLTKGIKGIIADIDKKLKTANGEQTEFYNTCKTCLNAVVAHSEAYAVEAERLASISAGDRKDELLKISELCRKVPENAAESFYEAIQSVHFITHCMSLNPYRACTQQFQLGHPDRYLYPFYERDIKNGIITKDEAQVLIDCLAITINTRVHNGLSSGYMVGGRDTDGKLVANELTMLLMQAIDDVRLVYPSVGLCYTPEMPDEYLEKAIEILSHGCSHPAIFNDDIITEGLKYYGVPEAEAHNYIHSTCVEITPVASSNVWVASPYTNMIDVLFSCMGREYASFDDLKEAVKAEVFGRIEKNYHKELNNRKIRCEKTINPLLSCFVNDCLEKGEDIERGGGRYNWIMPSFVGMANLVDSLAAIRALVFEEKKYTICDLKKICDNNFEGDEALRKYIADELPKYGNDNDEVDALFGEFTDAIAKECRRISDEKEKLIPSVFCWIMHERFGRETCASPDSRFKGFPLGDGSGPCQGREKKGPTASVLSSTKWSHKEFIGGVAVNMKFSKSCVKAETVDRINALIKTYIERGGFEMQINIVDRKTLVEAQKNPENYRDLVVRIGGYSDYFVTLSPEMQKEVIMRSEHSL